MILSTLLTTLHEIAPLSHAEPWDNVGLLLGDPHQPISQVLLTIDYTPDVAAEAIESKCNVVIAYHPPLFKPINRLTAGGPHGSLFEAARRGIAIYSPHTAWDAAPGGANDFLADVLMLKETVPLRAVEEASQACKLVTYVPAESADRVADAMFAAGAGKFGHYSNCSFRSTGTGTFLGDETTHPTVGIPGELAKANEIKIELLLRLKDIDVVVAALKKSHPYETPAFNLNPLISLPTKVGPGRIGKLPGQLTGDMLLNHIKHELRLTHLLVAGPTDKLIGTAACCAGSGGDLLPDAIAKGADFYLTGELRHHDAIAAAAKGVVVACTLHSNSERASLTWLRDRLLKALPELKIRQSERDRDPFSIV